MSGSEKIALVTGANGRVGRAISEQLTSQGYKVVGVDVAATSDAPFAYEQCDVTNHDAIVACVASVWAEHGPIQVLVNNAGIWHGKTFFDITPADYDLTYDVNTRGPFFLIQEVAKRLGAEGKDGVVINIASVVATAGSGVTDYGGSKAAVVNMTKSLCKPLGKMGIRINAVSPGSINSAMGDRVPKEVKEKLLAGSALGRSAEPQEIADAVTFLISDEARYITGATLDVNGGI